MKESHLKIFAGVFVFLGILYFITKPRHASVNLDEFVQNIVLGISKDDVASLEVYKQTSTEQPIQMIFAKKGDQWFIPTKFNAKAKKSSVDRLLTDILEMTGKVRSSDPKHFDTYHISDEQGLHLLLKDEAAKTLANLIIGKRAEDYSTGFVRFAGKDKVFAVDKNLLSGLSIYGDVDTLSQFKVDTFVDLEAVDQDKEKLNMVGVVANGKEVVIERIEEEVEVPGDSAKTIQKEFEWVLLKGKGKKIKLDQKEVANFFRDVAKIRAQEVVDRIGDTFADLNKSSIYGFNRPSHYIVFRKPDGAQNNVLFGKEYEKDQGYYMNVQYEGLVYKVTKYNFDKIFKWIEELPKKVAK